MTRLLTCVFGAVIALTALSTTADAAGKRPVNKHKAKQEKKSDCSSSSSSSSSESCGCGG